MSCYKMYCGYFCCFCVYDDIYFLYILILSGWYFQNFMFEEVELEFQIMVFFKIKIGIRNVLQVSLTLGEIDI